MRPDDRKLETRVRPRLTPELQVNSDYLDDDHFEKTGEHWYFETIDQTEYGVEPVGDGLAPETYWAEGWNFGYYEAYRSNSCGHDGALHRMFPTRYRVADFDLSRSFRRVLKKNADLKCVVRPFRTTPAKDELDVIHCYSRFRETKRPLSEIYKNWRYGCAPIRELTVFHRERGLIAFTLIEIGEKASYAIRTAWSPDEKHRSLGTFVFLKAVEYARSLNFEHHYVGPTLLADPSFSYKLRYPACELYDWDVNDWVPSNSERAKAMFAAPFPRRFWDPETEDFAK